MSTAERPTIEPEPPAHPSDPAPSSESSRKGARTFVAIFALSFVAFLGAVVAVNILGNGTKLFPAPGFPPSSSTRAWKARQLENLVRASRAPDLLVFGSSRVWSMDEADLDSSTGLKAFNFGVNVACPVDFVAQLRFATRLGVRPKRVIVGIDELAFGDNPEADLYDLQLVTHPGVFRELSVREQVPIIVTILRTITVKSTIASLRNLWHRPAETGQAGGSAVVPQDDARPFDWADLNPAERPQRLAAGIQEKVAFWGKYLDRPDKIDGMRPTERKQELFKQFLEVATAHGISVDVVLLPVHPEFERRGFPGKVLELRADLGRWLEATCRRPGVSYHDYTNLASFDGSPDEFQDGVHMTRVNARRLMAHLIESDRIGPAVSHR
jgi:hypothetical protein